uniref:Uncharacterized protein n=1 Tax=Odontella aurita TaxID=265563 RepID=A0A7S4N042_9STRA
MGANDVDTMTGDGASALPRRPPPPPPPRRKKGNAPGRASDPKREGINPAAAERNGPTMNGSGGPSSAVPSVASTADSAAPSPSAAGGNPPLPVSTPVEGTSSSRGSAAAVSGRSADADNPDSLSAAAELIHSLDRAFSEMSESAAEASREAEDARRAARNAGDVARRYASRNYRPSGASAAAAAGDGGAVAAAGGGRQRLTGGAAAANALAGAPKPAPYDYARPYNRISPRNGEGGTKRGKGGHQPPSGRLFGGSSSPSESQQEQGRVPQSVLPRSKVEIEKEPVLLNDDVRPKTTISNGRTPSKANPFRSSAASPSILPPASAKKRKNVLGTPLPSASGQAGQSPYTKMSPTTRDLLAHSHAEDVLSLSLELERTRQSLNAERNSHGATRVELTESKSKTVRLEEDVQRLLGDLESERERGGREIDASRAELERVRTRVSAAEEDAQLALDLAKGSAESREQVEAWLQRALDEIEALRNHLAIAQEGGEDVQAIRGGTAPSMASVLPVISEEGSNAAATTTAVSTAATVPSSPAPVISAARLHHPHPPPPRHGAASPSRGGVHGHAASGAAVMQQTTTTTTTTQTVTTHHAAGSMSPPPPPPKPHAPKAMISAGRDVLRRAATSSDEGEGKVEGAGADGADDGAKSTALLVPNQYDGGYWRELVQSSARKRDRLRGKLRTGDEKDGGAAAATGAMVPRRLGGAMTAAAVSASTGVKDERDPEKYAVNEGLSKRVSKMLKESGRRLKLGRNWWLSSSASSPKKEEEAETEAENSCSVAGLEGIVRSYCRSVEDRVSRVGEDLKEMRAFCEYLEAKVLASSSTSTVAP